MNLFIDNYIHRPLEISIEDVYKYGMGVQTFELCEIRLIISLLQCQSHTWHNCSLTAAHLNDATSTRNRNYRQCRTNAHIEAINDQSELVNRTLLATVPLLGTGTENKTDGGSGKSDEVNYQEILKKIVL